jgi:peptidoglycan/xylan/chitin deacetylase (PgdA/CDA1 family)
MEGWKKDKLVITMVQTKQKAVALTFDDGPDPEKTPAVLESLAKHQAKGTFFVVGNLAEKYPDLMKKIADQGHELANHRYSHSYERFSKNETAIFAEEIEATNKIISQYSNQKSIVFRPPGGYLSDNLVNFTGQNGIKIAYWTWQQDSKDWKVGRSSTEIASLIVKHIAPGQIIVLHDGANNGMQTARAVDLLATELVKEGYRFVTVSELLQLEGQ